MISPTVSTETLRAVYLFAIGPSKDGDCASKDISKKLEERVKKGVFEDIQTDLVNFPFLNFNLQKIADLIGKDKFAPETIFAYLLGTRGPELTHNTQILNQASASGLEVASFNKCGVRWGQVISVSGKRLRARLCTLEKHDGIYQLANTLVDLLFKPEYIPSIKKNDLLAVHREIPIKILTKEEAAVLLISTREALH